MTTAAIEYIWLAILESERSDEFQFMDAAGHRTPPDWHAAMGRQPITEIAINPKLAAGDPLQTVPMPPFTQP